MRVLKDLNFCTGCAHCVSVCPKKCITMRSNNEGFLFPDIDTSKCAKCFSCYSSCPQICGTKITKPISCFAVKDKDTKKRLKSASGGISSVFFEHFLNLGGVCTGVKFDEEFNAVHSVCKTFSEIDLFRDSKYVQSQIGNIYEDIGNALKKSKKVFVTGLPCQIAAIRKKFGLNSNLFFFEQNKEIIEL